MTAHEIIAPAVDGPLEDEFSYPPAESATDAISAVHLGIWISATRCVLTYVIAPAAGAIGIFLGPLGLVLQILGAVTASFGARNLWALGHRARYLYVFVAVAVTGATAATLAQSVEELVR
jgi:hypothetical protein